ncbi:SapC family protein [Microvirga sp. W0021]|uniref:SapC family protein n=1 Tax=Hohaiivirga grylli TaxID=3133970 RepID=A0ABV0BKT4_9HYPH
MSKVMLLYKNVTPLSRDAHKDMKLKPSATVDFAAEAHWTPVAGSEFYQASRVYPVVFMQEGTEADAPVMPIALLGLSAGHNDFVGKDGQWKKETYIPAFIRRYPFVLANTKENSEEFTICFDDSFAGLNTKEGRELFNKDGTNSELLEEAIRFMNGFRVEMERTQKFVALLKKYDLLEKRSADIRSASGVAFQVQDFLLVSEEKFSKLTGAQLAELHKEGFLGWIFAHLMSLGNLPGLLELHLANKGPAAAPAKGK